MTTTTTGNTATDKQIAFMNRLIEERDLTLTWDNEMPTDAPEAKSVAAAAAVNCGRDMWRQGHFTTAAASTVIEALLVAPRKESRREVPEGMHRVSDGTVYKVQRSPETGRLYAKELVMVDPGTDADEAPTFRFEYQPGALRLLSADTALSLTEAKKWGLTYGTCMRCGRTLTDEGSIAAGIGPVCAGKW